ncbi:SusC/RagA family TonB-linked outer membrane protein [Flavobacterium maritimum]|uniref:SusC/RagA family TonB-linked outer membrane protein n=1 Tax=Flavobacterium maritimum TaxID=3149042 RepID=UPI0032B42FEA
MNKKSVYLLVVFFSMFLAGQAFSQERKIQGQVISEKDGLPLPMVDVVVKNSKISQSTDMDGGFSLTIPEEIKNIILEFSFIGYKTKEIKIENQSTVKITLTEEENKLEEVVVVGYGTQRQSELTSSVSKVKSESFNKGMATDAGRLIQGKVAGVGVIRPTGDPTSTSQIMLRGVGTLKSGTAPLVLIDGVPGDLNTIAAEDIESIDVLKDGSAAAIYGTRGSNGVIFITSKKTKANTPLTLEISQLTSIQSIVNPLNMMNASEYRKLVDQKKPGAADYGYNTNWQESILQTPVSNVTNFSIKGANSESNYVANVNYIADEGIVKRSDNSVLNSRIEVNHKMFDNILKFNFSLIGREQQYQALGDGQSFQGEIYRNSLTHNPTDRPKDDNGVWTERLAINAYINPLAALYETNGKNMNRQLKSIGSVTITPIESLFFKALASRTGFNETRGYSETKRHISTVKFGKNGYASRGTTSSVDDLLELTSQYKKRFDSHEVTGLLGYSYQSNIFENYYMNNWDFPSDVYTYNNIGAGAALKRGEATMSSFKSESTLIGFFTRLNYNFEDKYLFSASFRREGSSKFGENNKWGNFPAASVGWNLAKENFIKSANVFDKLKLRVGFGVTGTIPTDPYMSMLQLSTSANFLNNGTWGPTLQPASNSNPNLKWETKEEWNFGLDYGILKGRISGSIDLYQRTTKDLLWNYQVPVPSYLYPNIIANAGTLENKGIEVQLNFVPLQNENFTWNGNVNYSTNTNKLVSLSNDSFQLKSGFIDAGTTLDPIQQTTHRVVVGGQIGDFYGYKSIDIDTNGRWIIEGQDGKPKPISQQSPNDKKVLGNGLPKHLLSFNNSFIYKNFDLNVGMRGAFDYNILNFQRMYFESPVALTRGNILSDAYHLRYGKTVLSDTQELQYVSYYIEDGSFWKIDNVTLGYNLDLNNKSIKAIRFYLTGGNLMTFTKYKGLDPEVNVTGLDPGNDVIDRYPSMRTFALGLNFNF